MKFIIFALLVTLACVFVIPSEAAAAPNDCGDTSALEKACEDLMNLPDGAVSVESQSQYNLELLKKVQDLLKELQGLCEKGDGLLDGLLDGTGVLGGILGKVLNNDVLSRLLSGIVKNLMNQLKTTLGGAGVVGCALVDLLAKAFAGSDLLGLGLGSNANNLNNLIGGSVGN